MKGDLLPRRRRGSGRIRSSFGYDGYNDQRFANNHQSGSDYRICNTDTIIAAREPVSSSAVPRRRRHLIQWNPMSLDDRWHELPHALAVLQRQLAGVERGHRQPRFALRPQPRRRQFEQPRRPRARPGRRAWAWSSIRWAISSGRLPASVAQIRRRRSRTPSRTSAPWRQLQTPINSPICGPDINTRLPTVSLTPTAEAIQQVFNWFNANGGTALSADRSP